MSIIPPNWIGHVDQSLARAEGLVSEMIGHCRRDLAKVSTEEAFFAMTRNLALKFVETAKPEQLPDRVLVLVQQSAQALALSQIRLAKLAEEAESVARARRAILEPGEEYRVGIMLPTGRIVEVRMTCETRGDAPPQLVAIVGAEDVRHVVMRTPENAKWDPL